MRKLFWGLTGAFGGYVAAGLAVPALRRFTPAEITDRAALIAQIVCAAIGLLAALIAAGNHDLERQRLQGYAKQACAPESDRTRLKKQLAAEIVWIILLNLLFGFLFIRFTR